MGWRERMLEAVPAWAAQLVSWIVLVAGWAAFGSDQEYPPDGVLLLALLLLMPTIGRMAFVRWWRAVAYIAVFFLAGVVTGPKISSLALWLLVVVVMTVPAAYWLIDRAWSPPWRSEEGG